MGVWNPGDLAAVEGAIAAAGAGTPTLVAIEGAPGTGKSTFMRELIARADGFVVLDAESPRSPSEPFSALTGFGLTPDAKASPFVVAQALRERIERAGGRDQRILVTVDDLQIADPESIEVLVNLVERAGGDRLLVCVTIAELAGRAKVDASQTLDRLGAIRIRLGALTLEQAIEMARTSGGEALTDDDISELWRQTEGNRLYLSFLLREHSPDDLTAMRRLPAPEAFAADTERRLRALHPDAIRLGRALAIHAVGWQALVDLADLADLDEPAPAADVLLEAALIDQRSTAGIEIRLTHPLVRSAIYQGMPLAERRELHLRAAGLAPSEDISLEHRFAAADRYDDWLADDLDRYARSRHDASAFRSAAKHLEWSARLTRDLARRSARRHDAVMERLMGRGGGTAGDIDAATLEPTDHDDPMRVALVRAIPCVAENRWDEAADLLRPTVRTPPSDDDDAIARYRAEVLYAWSSLGAGHDLDEIRSALDRAKATGVTDHAFSGFESFTTGQVIGRTQGIEGLDALGDSLPERPADVPLEQSFLLGYRGSTLALRGFFRRAIADLTEAELRLHAGSVDVGDGVVHATLGAAYWLSGEWKLADVKFRVARDLAREQRNPVTTSLTSLGASGAGDFEAADAELDAVRSRLRSMPWPEATNVFLIALVTRLHAGGDPDEQARARRGIIAALGPEVLEPRRPQYDLRAWQLATLAIWAGELDEASRVLASLDDLTGLPPWSPAARAWVGGLIAEASGRTDEAVEGFTRALQGGIGGVPFFEAHAFADRARVTGDAADRDAALAAYRRLGAVPYIERLSTTAVDEAPPTFSLLSDRERDVATLLAAGLSYAQIARDLFISRSTVGFHLSNIYAKTGVQGRHQLTDLVRSASVAA